MIATRILPFAAALLLWAPALHSQNVVAAGNVAIDEVDDDSPRLLTLDFSGGTVAEFVKLVRTKAAEGRRGWINLLVTGPADEIDMPPMEVRDAELNTVITAASQLLQPLYEVEFETFDDGNGGAPIFIVRIYHNEEVEEEQVSRRQMRVFPLRALTRTTMFESADLALTPETVLTAVQTAMDLATAKRIAATIRFHEGSGLLFVQGTREQVAIAADVIDQLTADMAALRSREAAGRSSMNGNVVPLLQPGPSVQTTGR